MLRLLLSSSINKGDATVYGQFTQFLQDIAVSINESVMLYIALAIVLLITVCITVARNKTYEKQLMKSVKNVNGFLKKNPYMNDENLIKLNSEMKKAPKAFRHSWQEYVLNRDKAPSEYMSTKAVVDYPTKTSGYKATIKICKNL